MHNSSSENKVKTHIFGELSRDCIEHQNWQSLILPPPVIGFANSIWLLPVDQLSIDHRHSFFLKLLQTPSPHGVDVSLYDSIAFPRMHIIQIVPFPLLPLLLLLLGRSKSFVVYYTTSSRARALTTQWVVLTIKRIWNVSSMCFLQKAKVMLSQTLNQYFRLFRCFHILWFV